MIKQQQRMGRALKQTMFLISAKQTIYSDTLDKWIPVDFSKSGTGNIFDKLNWDFCVEGTRGINYNVGFSEYGMNCTCPDFEGRSRNCKHMFFIIGRIAKLKLDKFTTDEPNFNVFELYPELSETLVKVLEKRLGCEETATLTSDDDCCICFETMNTKTLVGCHSCQNAFHDTCMKQWLSNSSRNNCPLCRTLWIKDSVYSDALGKFVSVGSEL